MSFTDPLHANDPFHDRHQSSSHRASTRWLNVPQSSPEGPTASSSSSSLAVNYLPTKFTGPPSNEGTRRRYRAGVSSPSLSKQGGGREAFRRNEARMPGVNDEDYDGVDNVNVFRKGTYTAMRWNKFKWILFISNVVVSAYSLVALVFCILTWLDAFGHADVVRVGNRAELILSTIAATLGVFTALLGWAGLLLNNRGFLAVYTFLLWAVFAFSVAPGYMTYKQRTFNLEGKLNAQWSRALDVSGRLRVQNQLHCCGYYSPFVEATSSQTCYARSNLPGCKDAYLHFERSALEKWYTVSFALVPVQLFTILVALLCSNHITYRWGKGMMPKAYRLNVSSLAMIADKYANQLADEYSKTRRVPADGIYSKNF